jgi:GH18 family chitinase
VEIKIMKKLISLGIAVAMLLCFTTLLHGSPQIGDTLKYRITYAPTWMYGELDPWNIDFGGLTHVINFTNGSMSQTSPYFLPLTSASDSSEIEFGFSGGTIHYLDSLTTICHRKNIKVMESIQCVSGTNFDYVASDSTRVETFFKAFKAWMIRKHIDGWDLDLESGGATQAQRLRFIRIGRRICYDKAFPNGRALIGIATGRGDEATWTASLIDTMITFMDMQAYTYQYMWSPSASANVTWFQTPVNSPASCANCENSSLKTDFLYGGKSFIDGYVANGHDKSKFVVGYATSCVTGFTGAEQLSTAWSNSIADNPLFSVEAMVNYGGIWWHDVTAHSSYIHGTAKAGNPLGISTGTKFFLPFEDSTDMKAGIDYLKSVGAGGIMFYDFYGDRRVNATPNWKKTHYIYTASVYAAKLNGGLVPVVPPVDTVPPVVPPSTDTTGNWTKVYNLGYLAGIKSVQLIDTTGVAIKWYQMGRASVICPPANCPPYPDTAGIRQAGIKQGEAEFVPQIIYNKKP